MENLDFSEEEIQQQLEALGYTDVPRHRLREFKRDLDELIKHEKSKSQSSSSNPNSPRSQSTSYLSLPTYTKIEVQDIKATSVSELYPKSGPAVRERQVFASNQRRDNNNLRTRTKCYDSYTHHTVTSKYPHHFASPNRLEREVDETQHLSSTVSQSPTPDRDTGGHGKPVIKRKVLRKLKGQLHVCDESAHSEDSASVGGASGLEEQLRKLQLSMSVDQDSGLEREEASCRSDRQSTKSQGFTLSAFESYMRKMTRSQSATDIKSRSGSFIHSYGHPHTRHFTKADPLTKYLQYKQGWEMFKAPGERNRRALCFGIREQLAYQPPPPRSRRLLPNTYVVPTEKKRMALRWDIRSDLAYGLLPPKVNYRL